MARDHALTLALDEGWGALRFYRWSRPTVSFGRNEPARGLYSQGEARRAGVGYVRRPTGGRAVLHHQELTYALVFPIKAFGGLKRAYRLINQGLLKGLEKLGAAVELAATAGVSLPPDAGPCFREPAEGEVTAAGRKLIGSAQVRMGRVVLQHGSIMLDGHQDLLGRLGSGVAHVPPPATLRTVLGIVPDIQELESVLQEGLAATLGGSWEEGGWEPDEKMAAESLAAHYEDPGWTWRV